MGNVGNSIFASIFIFFSFMCLYGFTSGLLADETLGLQLAYFAWSIFVVFPITLYAIKEFFKN